MGHGQNVGLEIMPHIDVFATGGSVFHKHNYRYVSFMQYVFNCALIHKEASKGLWLESRCQFWFTQYLCIYIIHWRIKKGQPLPPFPVFRLSPQVHIVNHFEGKEDEVNICLFWYNKRNIVQFSHDSLLALLA